MCLSNIHLLDMEIISHLNLTIKVAIQFVTEKKCIEIMLFLVMGNISNSDFCNRNFFAMRCCEIAALRS